LKRPSDPALLARVSEVLAQLKADPKNGIAEIAAESKIADYGANPQASFYVGFAPNAYAGSFKGAAAPLISPSASKGTHGYFPDKPFMRSSFMIMGKGIQKGRNLGEIDMRAIAPTLAKAMGLALADAEVPVIE
jgi:predicted AlkP superfamily pyrophosphatase or phosphodiesterase